MSSLNVDTINEKTTGNGVYIPGHIIQVQSSVQTGSVISSTSTSFQSTNHTVSITPTNTSSKILIMLQGGNQYQPTAGASVDVAMFYKIGSGAYTRVSSAEFDTGLYNGAGGIVSPLSWAYVHSPASTNTLTYEPYYRRGGGSGTAFYMNHHYSLGYGTASLIVMEIAQ